jgi:hypothetical protein
MLVIKKEQIEKFIAEDDTQLVRVLRDIIREAFHEGVAIHSDETLDGMIRIGIERAKSRGFSMAPDIAAFVAIMFEISPDFDQEEQIDAFLKDETFSDSMKIEQMLGRVQDGDWIKAEETYDPVAWFPEAETSA